MSKNTIVILENINKHHIMKNNINNLIKIINIQEKKAKEAKEAKEKKEYTDAKVIELLFELAFAL